jgi:hypothetical protein
MSCFGAGWTLFIICAKLPFAAATSHKQANDIAQHIWGINPAAQNNQY